MPTDRLSDRDLERIRRAADLLDEALPQLGLRPGVGKVKRALDTLDGVEGVEPVDYGSELLEKLREQMSRRFAAPSPHHERRAES